MHKACLKVLHSFFTRYESSQIPKISRVDKLQAHVSNLLSNYQHKKTTDEWVKQALENLGPQVPAKVIEYLKAEEYISLPEGGNKCQHDVEKASNQMALLKEGKHDLLKTSLKAFFYKK